MNAPQLIVSAMAMILLMSPLFLLAFVAGRRSHPQRSLRQFDGLPAGPVELTGSWRAEFDSDDPSESKAVQYSFRQDGCRVVATGRSTDGANHFLEGVLFEGRLCGSTIDEYRNKTVVGTLTAELQPDGRIMEGMRGYWSTASQALVMRKATFDRSA